MSLRVAIVEDDARFRKTLNTLLTISPGVSPAGAYLSAERALTAALEVGAGRGAASWDLVVMDIELPGISGIECTRRLKALRPELKIVMMTVFEEPSTILEAICAGADGYLLKSTSPEAFLEQVHAVASGGAPLSSEVAKTVLELVRARIPSAGGGAPTRLELTDRQTEVLRGLVAGKSYKQIAADLYISLDTVRSHIRLIYKKLQVNSVAEAVSRAIREQLV